MMKGKGIRSWMAYWMTSQSTREGRMRMSYDRNNEMRP